MAHIKQSIKIKKKYKIRKSDVKKAKFIVLYVENLWRKSDYMLKFDFTKEEYDKFIKDIMFSPLQERIINYRARKYSIVQMA